VRRVVLTGALLALAAVLGGCVQITAQTHQQQQTIGDMRLSTTFCLSYNSADSDCDPGNTNSNKGAGLDHARLLLGYRVPLAATPPNSISVTSTDPPGTLTLTPSPSYTSELQRLAAAPSGRKWVGYISSDVPTTSQNGGSLHTATANFGLGRGSNGSPFVGPFAYLIAIGVRGPTTAGAQAPTTVLCGSSLDTWNDDQSTICSDSPKKPAQRIGSSPDTKDVGVLDGTEVAAAPGTAVSVPFQIKSSGTALPIMNLSAGTTAPGASASSSVQQIQPNGATQSVPVSVSVASNTPPGTYDVSLTATMTNGQQLRVGKWKLRVTAPGEPVPEPPAPAPSDPPPADPPPDTTPSDITPPNIGFIVRKKPRLRKALKSGVPVTVVCDEGCAATVKLLKGTTKLGSAKGAEIAAGQFNLTARFTRAARKKYAKARSLKVVARVVVKDAAGNAATRNVKLKLKR
jgi:hypothetical protein